MTSLTLNAWSNQAFSRYYLRTEKAHSSTFRTPHLLRLMGPSEVALCFAESRFFLLLWGRPSTSGVFLRFKVNLQHRSEWKQKAFRTFAVSEFRLSVSYLPRTYRHLHVSSTISLASDQSGFHQRARPPAPYLTWQTFQFLLEFSLG